MNVAGTSVQDARRRSHVASLAAALRTERKLLDDLRGVLLRQRDGVAGNDLQTLDDSVYAAQRVFRTLEQARRKRKILNRLLTDRDDVPLAELEEALGRDATPDVLEARDGLVAAARKLAREVSLNRRIIDQAMRLGDQLIRAFGGAPEKAPVYGTGPQAESSGGPGAFVNTQV